MSIRRRIRDLQRIRHIVAVLVKYGFGYIIERLHLESSIVGRRILNTRTLRRAELYDMPAPVRLRKALEELGPTFIKFGQIMSMRPDLVTPSVARELEKLQDEVPGFPFSVVKEELEREFKAPLGTLFSAFSEEPKASASLAQVHEARLAGGEKVIVKVQRPGIEPMIETDIEILYELAHLVYRYVEESRLFDPVGIVDEFKRVIAREIDFVNEAYNADRFRTEFKDDPAIYIPRVYHQYTTRRVLTMEEIQGIKVTDVPALEKAGLDRRAIAARVADAVLLQVFRAGFFHADPHPGNILVAENNRVVFLDFGMVGRIPQAMKSHLADVLAGVIDRDIPLVREAFLAVGNAGENISIAGLDADLEDFIDYYYGKPLRELNVGHVLMNLIDIVSRHRIRLPPDLFMLSKVLMIVDGVARTLDPDFNMVDRTRPFVRELQLERFSPRTIARNLRRFARNLSNFTRALPRDLAVIFDKLKQGTLQVEFEHRGLEPLTFQVGKASNRVAFSLIIAALIIGSSIVLHAGFGPRYYGLSVVGLLGFAVAAILGLWLIIVMLSSGSL